MIRIILFCILIYIIPLYAKPQAYDNSFPHLFTPPKTYVALKTGEGVTIDGRLDEKIWDKIPWSEYFLDIEGSAKPLPAFITRVKLCWDDQYLYIAAYLEEPHINGILDIRDQVIYYDNDFEVFIDPNGSTHNYFEIEINALNTIFDLKLPKPYRNGGRADIPWDVENLKHAVSVNGSINDPSDIDSSWTIEMAIPFNSIEENTPSEGDIWNINFSRVQWKYDISEGQYVKTIDPETGRHYPEDNWVWSPQGVINMHYPERWGYLFFTEKEDQLNNRELPEFHQYKEWLWLLYYRQKNYSGKNITYAANLQELDLAAPKGCKVNFSSNQNTFTAILNCESGKFSINEEGLFLKYKSYE